MDRTTNADTSPAITTESWVSVFPQNLTKMFSADKSASLVDDGAPAAFWPDVFVDRRLPWMGFLRSGAYHVLALAMIWAASRFLALQPRVTVPAATFTHAEVIYYSPSEYLPPLDTRTSSSSSAQQADPEYSAQPIISVPPEAENHSQTIVTAPSVQLHNDVALPNVVALLERSADNARMPIGPAPLVPASEITRLAPQMERPVIAPPPQMEDKSRTVVSAPEAAVIAPPPTVEVTNRRVGDFNVGHSSVIAPAPQLALDEQRAFTSRTSDAFNRRASQVIAPPPSVGAAGQSRSGRGLIALNLHPAVGAPADPPAGNRRGSFASTPEGRRGASGAAGAATGDNSTGGPKAANGRAGAAGSNVKGQAGLPSGLYVGKAANTVPVAGEPGAKKSSAYAVNPNLIANVRPPRLGLRSQQSDGDSKLTQEERAVFGNRKFYSLSLNMPNLNSAGGSWIIRFAALRDSSSGGLPSQGAAFSDGSSGEVSAPLATSKVDPAYPLELMRQNLGGTVILYAVIHADGSVGNVRVLRSVDERLDQYASDAIAKWKFDPATRNGAPVDVEATFWIPFRPARAKVGF